MRLSYIARRWLQLAPQVEEIALVHGHRMAFAPNSECYFDMTHGAWEPGVTRLFDSLIKREMVVVDAGAHIGYYTLLAARKVGPTGKVYAFEPAPSNYDLLAKNIDLNGYQNVVPVRKAVSNGQGIVEFFLRPDSLGHSLHPVTLVGGKATSVEAITLDGFFEGEGWPPVHLVKMDIEGAEPAALEGMAQLLERNSSMFLILEYIPYILERTKQNPHQFLTKLRGLGFTIYVITDKDGPRLLEDNVLQLPEARAELLCVKKTLSESTAA